MDEVKYELNIHILKNKSKYLTKNIIYSFVSILYHS